MHVEWAYQDRLFRLVDTAGLTRMRVNKKLLLGVSEKRFNRSQQNNMSTAYDNGDSKRSKAIQTKSFLPAGKSQLSLCIALIIDNRQVFVPLFSCQVLTC